MLAEAAGSSFNTDEGSLGTDVSFRCFAGAGGMFTLQAVGRTLQALALQGKEGLYLEDRRPRMRSYRRRAVSSHYMLEGKHGVDFAVRFQDIATCKTHITSHLSLSQQATRATGINSSTSERLPHQARTAQQRYSPRADATAALAHVV